MSEADSRTATGSTRVRLHPLRSREDHESVIVGRVDTGDFISVPPAGHRTIVLLSEGHSVDEVRAQLRDEAGTDVDVAGFVASLIDLGFVAEIDGRTLPQPPAPTPTFPRVRPQHVRWLLHPAVAATVPVIAFGAAVAVARDPSLVPSYQDLLWSGSGGAVILGNAAIGWALMLLHELAHLFTARAAGVPGRMSLGTRLQFLVAQTDVSGVWVAPRRSRLAVYLSGIALNVAVSGAAVLVIAAVDPVGVVRGVLAAVALISVAMVPLQFLVFMRTDVYFVIQDLSGCANLYADGAAYATFHARRAVGWLRPSGGERPEDPSRRLRPAERRAVRAYTVVLVLGTAACLAIAALVTLPFVVVLFAGAVHTLVRGGTVAELLDAAAVLTTTGLVTGLWARAWWRRHGHRVRRRWGRAPQQTEGGDPAW